MCSLLSSMLDFDLIICGDFKQAPLLLRINDTDTTLVSEVKSRVSKIIEVPVKELMLYFDDSTLPDDTLLSHWKGLRGGAAVLVGANPLRVTLQRYNSDVEVKLEISRLTTPRWPIKSLFSYCLFKAGMPRRKDGKYLFVVDGMILDESKQVSDYNCLNDDFTMMITFVQSLSYKDAGRQLEETVYVPITVSNCCFEKSLSPEQQLVMEVKPQHQQHPMHRVGFFGSSAHARVYCPKWKLTVQKIDGSKSMVELKNHFLTPVYELRQQISPDSNIRLTFGSTILEDWDEEGNIMLLCNYPDLHDGAILYQINLTRGIRVELKKVQPSKGIWLQSSVNVRWNIKVHDQLHFKLNEYLEVKPTAVMYIEDPQKLTVAHFINVVKNCGQVIQSRDGFKISPSNNPVSTVIDSINAGSMKFNWQ